MAVHPIEPVAPTLHVPRGHPCAARIDATGLECGATPALLFRRICLHSHVRDLHLCGAHERGIAAIAACRDCAELREGAHRCRVALVRVPEAVDLIRAAAR